MSSIIRNALKLVILVIAFVWTMDYAKKRRCRESVTIGVFVLLAWEVIYTICWGSFNYAAEFATSATFLKIFDMLVFIERIETIPMDVFLIIMIVVMYKLHKHTNLQKTEDNYLS